MGRSLLVLWLLLSAGLVSAQTLKLEGGWVRLVPGPTTAAYLTLSNRGSTPIRLVAVSSPVAAKVEMHQTVSMDHGGMGDAKGMRPVEAIVVPAKGQVELKPGGMHLMMVGLKRPLKEGEKILLIFKLEGGKTFALTLPVRLEAP